MSGLPGEAGVRGADVRSDCWVGIAEAKSLKVEITSRVEALYGKSLRALITDGVEALGLGSVRVTLEDAGALPWVIMARLEAAARRAFPDRDFEPWLPERVRPAGTPVRDRRRRSRLYLPGDSPKFMLNAGRHAPDGVILDLEDSVAPARKNQARLLVRNALRAQTFGEAEVMVRINQAPLGLEDLAAVVPHGPALILIPKVESPGQVEHIEERCRLVAERAGVPEPLLMPILESAKGVLFAYQIATASERVAALTIGLEDYTADLGVERTEEGRESFWARSQVVNAARAAGVQAIDTVYSDVADADGLRRSVLEAKGLGFVGKGCIHPRQILVIHEAFAPTPAEIAKALRIEAAWKDAEARGEGVVSLGTRMIDPPVVARARRTADEARSLGLIPSGSEAPDA